MKVRSPFTCEIEAKAKNLLSAYQAEDTVANGNRAPMFIRGVFHDALDANNLLEKDDSGNWVPNEADKSGLSGWSYGGVDGCLYSTLAVDEKDAQHCEDGEDGDKMPCPGTQHNRNIGPAFDIATKVCEDLAVEDMDDCVVDIMVLGSIVAVSNSGGPAMTMHWGRKKGNCSQFACTTSVCKDVTKAIDLAPQMFALDDMASFRKTWQELGFNEEEETALMGAHTFGKQNVFVGGLNGAMRGHSCDKPEKMIPSIAEAQLRPQCEPKAGDGNHCWQEGTRKSNEGCNGLPCTYAPDLHPVYPIYGRYFEKEKDSLVKAGYEMLNSTVAVGEGFADGGVWDQTPEVFDNDYFVLLQNESLSQANICCGPVGEYKDRKFNAKGAVCLEVGDEKKSKCTKRPNSDPDCAEKMTNRVTGDVAATPEICSAKWCRYGDKKGRGHMKSPTLWHEPGHNFVKKADKHGAYKRLIRLAGDWALLSQETKSYVDKFAADQNEFFAAFGRAFSKVMDRGYSAGELSPCSP